MNYGAIMKDIESQIGLVDIEWDFVMWEDRRANYAHLKGIDQFGGEWGSFGFWYDGGLLYEPEDIFRTKIGA